MTAALTITHAITEDLPDGQPWPPDGDGFWSIVRRANGCTKWRRVILQMPTSILPLNDVRTASGGTKAKRDKNE